MDILVWVLFYIFELTFWCWIVRWGGAEWLEGTLASGFLIQYLAPTWTAEGIKFFVWVYFVVATIWFIVGIFVPSLRFL